MTTHITQTTHCFTLQQLRAATQAGGVAGVSLKAQGNGFFVQIQLRTGQQAVLVTARSKSPRMFKNPVQSFGVLRRVGIVTGSFDITHFTPEQHSASDKPEKKTNTKTNKTAKASNPKTVTERAPVITVPDAPPETTSTPNPSNQSSDSKDTREPKNIGVQQSLI